MDNSLVSAIITTHNRSPGIVHRAVESVLCQTYDKIEVIVVDDSDSDYSLRTDVEATIKETSEKIIYIKNKTNRGSCAARNTGLSVARGYYVAFLDDDDEWYPEKIEKQIKGFIDDSVALVYSDIFVVDELNNREYIAVSGVKKRQIFDDLLKHNIIGTTSNPIMKKHCLEKAGGFDELMQSSQDLDLWLRMAKEYSVEYIHSPLVKYHIHSGERISSDDDKKISGIYRLNLKYSSYINADLDIWYHRNIILIPYYRRKYGRKQAISQLLECAKKRPLKVLENFKYFILIVFGYDDHISGNRCIHTLLRGRMLV